MSYSAAELDALPASALVQLLGALVSLSCASGARHVGVLCSADPLTRSLALLQARLRRRARSGAHAERHRKSSTAAVHPGCGSSLGMG
jgi:hypothetical protein